MVELRNPHQLHHASAASPEEREGLNSHENFDFAQSRMNDGRLAKVADCGENVLC